MPSRHMSAASGRRAGARTASKSPSALMTAASRSRSGRWTRRSEDRLFLPSASRFFGDLQIKLLNFAADCFENVFRRLVGVDDAHAVAVSLRFAQKAAAHT